MAVGELAVDDRESMTLGVQEHQRFKQRCGGQRVVRLAGMGLLALLALSSTLGFAQVPKSVPTAAVLPTGGKIAAGSAIIKQSGTTLTVTQKSARLVANWNTFSVGKGDTVNFVQPS